MPPISSLARISPGVASTQRQGDAASSSFGVVVVNWNRAEDTIECLRSLLSAEPGPERIVVVDNGSTDASIPLILGWLRTAGLEFDEQSTGSSWTIASFSRERVTLLGTSTNRGYSGGNNIGLQHLQREKDLSHVLLLNNDAAVAPDYFAEAAAALSAVPNAGLLSGTIYLWNEPRRAWYAGGRAHPLRAIFSHRHHVPTDGTPRETEFITGCAMVVSRVVLRHIGFLPECYFPGYMEDGELCWRVRAAGYPLIYAPKVAAYHKVGATHGPAAESPLVTFSQNRHRVFFARRNLRGLTRAVALAYMLGTKPIRALFELLRGRPAIGWAVLRGTAAGFITRLS